MTKIYIHNSCQLNCLKQQKKFFLQLVQQYHYIYGSNNSALHFLELVPRSGTLKIRDHTST